MSSRRVVDLRKRKPAKQPTAYMRPLSFASESKRSPLRARRRRARILAGLGMFTVLVAAAYGVSYASYLPQFTVQRIEVLGVENIRPALIRAFVATKFASGSYKFLSESNIFLYSRAEIESAVKEYFSRVADVKVSRESLFATSVTVLVEERTSFARWCEANTEALASCYAMDGTGFVFAPIASTSPGFQTPYVFEGALSATSAPVGQQYLPSTFSALLALLERLGQAGYSPEHIVVEGAQDFSIHLARNFALRASFGMDIGSLIRNFELILSSEALRDREGELEYIDLRFGNRVYYKLKGSEQQSVQ